MLPAAHLSSCKMLRLQLAVPMLEPPAQYLVMSICCYWALLPACDQERDRDHDRGRGGAGGGDERYHETTEDREERRRRDEIREERRRERERERRLEVRRGVQGVAGNRLMSIRY